MCFRVEKEFLETSLFEAQELVAQLEARKEQLEGEKQGIELTKQNLQGTVCTELNPNNNFLGLTSVLLLHCIGRESPTQILNIQFGIRCIVSALAWITQVNPITKDKQGQSWSVFGGKPGSPDIGRQ